MLGLLLFWVLSVAALAQLLCVTLQLWKQHPLALQIVTLPYASSATATCVQQQRVELRVDDIEWGRGNDGDRSNSGSDRHNSDSYFILIPRNGWGTVPRRFPSSRSPNPSPPARSLAQIVRPAPKPEAQEPTLLRNFQSLMCSTRKQITFSGTGTSA